MNLVVTLLIGVAVGAMVELLLPGHHFSELVLAMILGAMGALLARFLGEMTGWYEAHEAPGFLGSIVGAIVALLIYGILFRRGVRSPRS
jgi:uncharacterized membrane protein YeaQ/YmgE (transglycosylase-associated protein family)